MHLRHPHSPANCIWRRKSFTVGEARGSCGCLAIEGRLFLSFRQHTNTLTHPRMDANTQTHRWVINISWAACRLESVQASLTCKMQRLYSVVGTQEQRKTGSFNVLPSAVPDQWNETLYLQPKAGSCSLMSTCIKVVRMRPLCPKVEKETLNHSLSQKLTDSST